MASAVWTRGIARFGALASAVALGSAGSGAHADEDLVSVADLAAVRDADPLELARIGARLGDGTVVRAIASGGAVAERLAVVRVAPWLLAPESALPSLVTLLASRDSELAPAAARSVARIVAALDADTLGRREVMSADLAPVRAALRAAANDASLRADVRVLAGEAAAGLDAAGVP
jgi:hypothetical protein